jgi:hypothetical protein
MSATKWKTALLLLGLAIIAAGCASRGAQLLRLDYQAMSDEELLQYYYQLDEEVAKCEARLGRTSVGVGTGYGTGGFGLGVGVSQAVGGCDLDALRQRRGEVRFLLKKREISP